MGILIEYAEGDPEAQARLAALREGTAYLAFERLTGVTRVLKFYRATEASRVRHLGQLARSSIISTAHRQDIRLLADLIHPLAARSRSKVLVEIAQDLQKFDRQRVMRATLGRYLIRRQRTPAVGRDVSDN